MKHYKCINMYRSFNKTKDLKQKKYVKIFCKIHTDHSVVKILPMHGKIECKIR